MKNLKGAKELLEKYKIMKEHNGKLYILVAECDRMEFKDYR